MIKLCFLGNPQISVNGEEIHLSRKKSLALLAYAALSEIRLSRSQICGVLWPDKDESHGRSALRTTLSTLNSEAGAHLIESENEYFMLNSSIETDVRLFREKAKSLNRKVKYDTSIIKDLRESASLYTGDFLSGFTLGGSSPLFDDWQYMQLENLKKIRADVLERLVQLYTLASNFKEATMFAEQWAEHQPDNEHTHRRLMELYAWQGRKRDALRQYEKCASTLERELDLEPDESTVRLYDSIRKNRIEMPEEISEVKDSISQEQILENSVFYSTVLSIGLANSAEKIVIQRPYDTASMVDILFHNNVESILKKNSADNWFILGDSIISLFGIPNSTEEDGYHALMAAIEILQTASTYGLIMTAAISTDLLYYRSESDHGGSSSLIGPAVTEANLLRFYGDPGEVFTENNTWIKIKDMAAFEKQNLLIPGLSRSKDVYMLKTGNSDYRSFYY